MIPRMFFTYALNLCSILAFAACQTRSIRLTDEQKRIQMQLQNISPAEDPLAARTQIIDIHTHTFNARYLPLRNILLGKRDVAPPFSWLISDDCARTLAEAVIDRTELAPLAGKPGARRAEGPRPHSHSGLVCNILLGLLNKAAMAGCWNKGVPPKEQLERLDAVADSMNMRERIAIRTAAHMMGMEETLETPNKKAATRGVVRFLWTLTQNDTGMTELYRHDYSNAPVRGTPLMVSHTMDLGPVYDQEPENTAFLDFATEQVPRAEACQARRESGMMYFVAYNPYRDHWRGGKPNNALHVVQKAVEKHAAWGVKVYPPSGYRPSQNQIRPRPGTWFTKHPKQQWDARYAALGPKPEANAKLDQEIEALLLWCRNADIPVFVHSGTGEFEARKGYGLHHSNPRYWRRFLETHPEHDGSPCRLRLCFGHAGGEDFWFGEGKHADWGREVYDLCREFPNVYCEITTHRELTDPKKQAWFVDKLFALTNEAPLSKRAVGHRYPPRFQFSKKLIYGTDWYLPDSAERLDVLRATQQAFLHEKLRSQYRDYFFANAVRYLNVSGRLRDAKHPVHPAVRERLKQFSSLTAEPAEWTRHNVLRTSQPCTAARLKSRKPLRHTVSGCTTNFNATQSLFAGCGNATPVKR
ncbi:MAG: amidohydrolase [Verrucomicrobiota bacterium]|nr:amidohydrolase [Verrucomicrobiota bacterium]